MKKAKGKRGFSLVELCWVISIIAVLASISFPALVHHLPQKHLRSKARDIYSAIMLAKSEAIRRQRDVTILFNSGEAPYIVFLDNNKNYTYEPPPPEGSGNDTSLAKSTPLNSRLDFDSAQTTFSGGALIFDKRGLPKNSYTGGLGAGSVRLCIRPADPSPPETSADCQRIIVSSAGRVRLATN